MTGAGRLVRLVRLLRWGVWSLAMASCAPNRGQAYERALAEARRAHHAGRFEAAAERFDAAAAGASQARDAIYAKYEAALARARAGDVARASRDLRALADATPPHAYSAQAAFKAAELSWQRDPAEGSTEMEEVAGRFPDDGVGRAALRRALRADAGAEQALTRLERVGARVGGHALEEDVAYERAKRLAELERHPQALAAFLEVAQRWPYPHGGYFDDALFRASELEEALGRPQQAIAHLERMLSFRESATVLGSYERPRYVPALLRIAALYENALGDRASARAALHRLYRDFRTSTQRDDALWREAELWRKDGDGSQACDRLATLVSQFPDSRYVPCAMAQCATIHRPQKSHAPTVCRGYLGGDREP